MTNHLLKMLFLRVEDKCLKQALVPEVSDGNFFLCKNVPKEHIFTVVPTRPLCLCCDGRTEHFIEQKFDIGNQGVQFVCRVNQGNDEGLDILLTLKVKDIFFEGFLCHFHLVSTCESKVLKEAVVIFALGINNHLFSFISDPNLLLTKTAPVRLPARYSSGYLFRLPCGNTSARIGRCGRLGYLVETDIKFRNIVVAFDFGALGGLLGIEGVNLFDEFKEFALLLSLLFLLLLQVLLAVLEVVLLLGGGKTALGGCKETP
jgi:hypothetical protein